MSEKLEAKVCIYDSQKVCTECGDCRCDLDPNKVCDNCEKCLELEGKEYLKFKLGDMVWQDAEGDRAVARDEDMENDAAAIWLREHGVVDTRVAPVARRRRKR